MTPGDAVRIGDVTIRGVDVDPETRCAHYHDECDVVAIEFPCCDTYYPCFRCHEAAADHDVKRWPAEAADERAVRCGACGTELSIEQYVCGNSDCPGCGTDFNPNCSEHYDRYFELDG